MQDNNKNFFKNENKINKPIISIDILWNQIEGEFCRVKTFLPYAEIKENKIIKPAFSMPYAILDVENPHKLPPEGAFLPVFHKIDFKHLWEAFVERGINIDEEVLVIYYPETPNNVPSFMGRIFKSHFFPKLTIWICKKGLLEKLYDKHYQESVDLIKFYVEEAKPIKEWRPFQEVE